MKTILAATAASLLFATAAFAETSAMNTRTTLDEMAGGDTAVIDILMDDQGMERSEEDFMARWNAATPEQQASLRQACTDAQEQKVEFTDAVQASCKVATGN